MSKYKTFEDLDVWKKSIDLVEFIYRETRTVPFSKDYGMIDQIRRSAVSISANIAEGMERDGNKELLNFLYISKGSCGELICHLHIAKRLGYIDSVRFAELYNFANDLIRSLGGLIKYLKDSDLKGKKYN